MREPLTVTVGFNAPARDIKRHVGDINMTLHVRFANSMCVPGFIHEQCALTSSKNNNDGRFDACVVDVDDIHTYLDTTNGRTAVMSHDGRCVVAAVQET